MNAAATNIRQLNTMIEALEHIGQGVTVFDENLRLVACNAVFLKMLDFPQQLSEPGTFFGDFIRHNALRGEYGGGDIEAAVAERVAQAQEFVPHAFDRSRPDGTVLHVAGTPLPAGGFVTVYSDVTSERTREAELEERVARRTEELNRNQARLSLIANEIKAGIVFLDSDEIARYANQRFARAYGTTPDGILGRYAKDVISARTHAACKPYFDRARRGESTDFDLNIVLPDGREKYVRTYLRPETSDDGAVTGFYVLSVDVTRQRASDLALANAQKMEALGTLSAGIAHDFNNLLTIVLGNLVPLRDRMEEGELVPEFLDPAIAAARRGTELTARLLSLTKGPRQTQESVPAKELISDCLDILRASLPAHVTLQGPGDSCGPWIKVDRNQFEMAIINLAVNGAEALEKSAGTVSISCNEVTLGSEAASALRIPAGLYTRVSVSDSGSGIDPATLPRLFDPFFTTKADKGAGLGLAMVHGFATNSAGAIEAKNLPGGGASFSVYLPTVPPSATASTAQAPSSPAETARQSGVVLLVEDDPDVRRVLRRQLLELGANVIEAETAEEAEQLLGTVKDAKLVLCDISLPGPMSGVDLYEKQYVHRPDVAFVLMTGHGADSVPNGNVQILQKPVEDDVLAQALAAVLASKPT
ncbi:MAG: PAS-domain containing protein [Donghicola eburneus]|nr:PAS-domain containing protein [Donghicola eburneus]MCI5042468.1 PAS-domain containing protein [Donghicola eburneus]MEE3071349.1 PAS-domain containing protein [Pseudomonadota bacterium]